MSGTFLAIFGVALASSFKIAEETISDRFLIDVPPSGTTKNIEKPMVFLTFLLLLLARS